MKVLITGVTGMAGSHLAEYYLNNTNYEIYGCCRWRGSRINLEDISTHAIPTTMEAKQLVPDKKSLNLVNCDITDGHSVDIMLESVRPDIIHHLAAQSFVPASWNSPTQTINTNINGTINLFESALKFCPYAMIHIACSSEQYGKVDSKLHPLITEETPFNPLSVYGISKIAQEKLAYQYNQSFALKTIVTRAFNHEGPRREKSFVISNFCRQIALMELGIKNKVLYVGDTSSKRDWTHVKDMVKAYYLMVYNELRGPLNIGTGECHSIAEVIGLLKEFANVEFDVVQDTSRLRPSNVNYLNCDSSKFRKATGWRPEYNFKFIVLDTLNYWRDRVHKETHDEQRQY